MRKKVLSIVLALLMCFMGTMTAFAEGESEELVGKASVTASFGLKNVSGSTYKMWAQIINPNAVSVSATLTLYDVSYNYITSVSTTSSNTLFTLSKNVTLSSGTYHLRLSYTASGSSHAFEKTYNI